MVDDNLIRATHLEIGFEDVSDWETTFLLFMKERNHSNIQIVVTDLEIWVLWKDLHISGIKNYKCKYRNASYDQNNLLNLHVKKVHIYQRDDITNCQESTHERKKSHNKLKYYRYFNVKSYNNLLTTSCDSTNKITCSNSNRFNRQLTFKVSWFV